MIWYEYVVHIPTNAIAICMQNAWVAYCIHTCSTFHVCEQIAVAYLAWNEQQVAMLLQQLLLSPSLSPWNGRKMIPDTCCSIRKVKYCQICLWFVHYYYSQPWSLAMITNEYEAFIRVRNAVHTLQLQYINFTSGRVKKSYLHFLPHMHVRWTTTLYTAYLSKCANSNNISNIYLPVYIYWY